MLLRKDEDTFFAEQKVFLFLSKYLGANTSVTKRWNCYSTIQNQNQYMDYQPFRLHLNCSCALILSSFSMLVFCIFFLKWCNILLSVFILSSTLFVHICFVSLLCEFFMPRINKISIIKKLKIIIIIITTTLEFQYEVSEINKYQTGRHKMSHKDERLLFLEDIFRQSKEWCLQVCLFHND